MMQGLKNKGGQLGCGPSLFYNKGEREKCFGGGCGIFFNMVDGERLKADE